MQIQDKRTTWLRYALLPRDQQNTLLTSRAKDWGFSDTPPLLDMQIRGMKLTKLKA
jgi:hypothetical protein